MNVDTARWVRNEKQAAINGSRQPLNGHLMEAANV
jgi:hypothetical protein